MFGEEDRESDARLHVEVTRRSHSRGSGMPPAFLDIVAAFALFCRSAINLTIYRDFDPSHI